MAKSHALAWWVGTGILMSSGPLLQCQYFDAQHNVLQ